MLLYFKQLLTIFLLYWCWKRVNKKYVGWNYSDSGHLIFLLLNVCALIWKKELYCLMKRKHFYSSVRSDGGREWVNHLAHHKLGEDDKRREGERKRAGKLFKLFCHFPTWPRTIYYSITHWIGMELSQYIFFMMRNFLRLLF